MNRISLVSFVLVLSSISVALAGCAADADTSEEEQSTVVVAPSHDSEAIAPRYVAKVTRADIIGGFGTCVGTLCTINGQMWDCSGGGYCTKVSM